MTRDELIAAALRLARNPQRSKFAVGGFKLFPDGGIGGDQSYDALDGVVGPTENDSYGPAVGPTENDSYGPSVGPTVGDSYGPSAAATTSAPSEPSAPGPSYANDLPSYSSYTNMNFDATPGTWTGDLSGAKAAFADPADMPAENATEDSASFDGNMADGFGGDSFGGGWGGGDMGGSGGDSDGSDGGDSGGGSGGDASGDSGGGDSGGDSGGGDGGGGGGDGGGGEKRGGRIIPHFAYGGHVAQALKLTNRHGYATDGEVDDAPEVITPAALARRFTAPEEADPRLEKFQRDYPEAIYSAPGKIADWVSERVALPKQYMTGEKSMYVMDPETGEPRISDEAIGNAFDIAGMGMTGGFGGAAAKAGETVLGSGPVRRISLPEGTFEGFKAVPDKIVSPYSQSPEHVKEALRIASTFRVPEGAEFGTGTFYNIKPQYAVKDIAPVVEGLPGVNPLDPRKMSWEDFYQIGKGGTLLNVAGDRSNLGLLKEINGQPLAWDVPLHAGPKYMLEPNPGYIWANNPSHATAFKKKITEAAENGKPVYGAYTPMGPQSADSSYAMFDALMAQVPGSGLTKEAAQNFDSAIMSGSHVKGNSPKDVALRNKAAELLQDWPGIANAKEASEFAKNLPGIHRNAIVKFMDTKSQQQAGLPSVGTTRVAITDPEVRNMPGNMIGHRIVQFDPEGLLRGELKFDHPSYPAATSGKYIADVPAIQRHYALPDVMEKMVANPAKGGLIVHPYSVDALGRSTARKLLEEQKQLQPINERMIESIGRGLERQKEYGFKKGGRVYPVRNHQDWEEAHDYEKTGGKLTHMSPDEYLSKVKPLNMDHDDKHLIHHFKKQIKKGEKLDPIAIYPDGHPNGRHRAHAAKEIGIKSIPVVTWPKKNKGGSVVDRALMITSKKA